MMDNAQAMILSAVDGAICPMMTSLNRTIYRLISVNLYGLDRIILVNQLLITRIGLLVVATLVQ